MSAPAPDPAVAVWAWRVDAPDGLRVWCFSLQGQASADDWGLLDAAETGRAHRFVFERDRQRFVKAHAGLRRLLGAALQRPPADLVFRYGPHGKPFLGVAGDDPSFNLSHGGDLGALVVAEDGREVGIDIEPWRPIADAAATGAAVFTRQEQDEWLREDPARREAAFLRLWTRKEAVLKALGTGLSLPPDQVEVGLGPPQARAKATLDGLARPVWVASLEGVARSALAVAWL